MTDPDANNPYAAPADDNVEVIASQTGQLASRWARLGGALVDTILMMIIIVPLLLATGIATFSFDPEQIESDQTDLFMEFIGAIIGLGAFLLLNGYLLLKRGQTIGKVALKTRIVDHRTGTIPPFSKAYGLRYLVAGLLGLIPFIGNLWGIIDALFIFSHNKRCLHDHIAGTIVVKA